MAGSESPALTEFFLTAPTERIHQRRGDPLGFRAAADRFADILAPGLSNRTYDARWLTLLCWTMMHVGEARRAFGYQVSDDCLEQRRDIYEWIRPLELLWIEAAIRELESEPARAARQLPGRRAVARYWDEGAKAHQCGLSDEQWERYRFTGPHGAYRSLLSGLPGFTEGGDGHRAGGEARRLADVIDRATPGILRTSAWQGRRPAPERFWAGAWADGPATTVDLACWLPTDARLPPRLRAAERSILESALFGDSPAGQRRRMVASHASRAKGSAHSRFLAELVARVLKGMAPASRAELEPLPAFSQLADAGVDAINQVWNELAPEESRGPTERLARLAARPQCVRTLDALRSASSRWSRVAQRWTAPVLHPVHELAMAILSQGTDRRSQLEALVRHHLSNGGGRRWFRLDGEKLCTDVPRGSGGAALYRFRLWSLCRLAWQTGVTYGMPPAVEPATDDDEPERDK